MLNDENNWHRMFENLPVDDERNVEAKDECEGDGTELVLAVGPQRLECFS